MLYLFIKLILSLLMKYNYTQGGAPKIAKLVYDYND